MNMELKVLRWNKPFIPEEVRLRDELTREGYSIFKWADSAGTTYPSHQHDHHESIWILEGEIEFEIGEVRYRLGAGDRLFLPRGMVHTAVVPPPHTCFYLVGEKE